MCTFSLQYLFILAGSSDGFWRKPLLDQNTNGLAGVHENTDKLINLTISYVYNLNKNKYNNKKYLL